MMASVSRRFYIFKERVTEHMRVPLYRNGYALAASSAVTSSIGVLYWILATHYYPAEVVGLNSAIISMMMFLGGLSQLNLMTAHIRFIPNAGLATRRFIALTYLVALAVAALIGLIYLANIHIFSPALEILRTSNLVSITFVLATMGWTVFVLQDSALTGLRQTVWVPVENAVFAVAKIVLMILLSFIFPHLGLFLSWVLALVITLLPINYFIFWRFGPRHEQSSSDHPVELVPKQVIQYAGSDFLGALFWLGATTLLPVMVTQAAGSKANAYFFLDWQIAYVLHLLSSNMGSSLIVEASTNQSKLGEYSRRVILQLVLLVGSAALVVIIGAPLILRIFGQDYSIEGTGSLRLLALAAIPNIVTSVYVSISRVQRKMRRVVFTLGVLCTLVLSLSSYLLPRFGIEGAGIAWLGSQLVVAFGILIILGVKYVHQ